MAPYTVINLPNGSIVTTVAPSRPGFWWVCDTIKFNGTSLHGYSPPFEMPETRLLNI